MEEGADTGGEERESEWRWGEKERREKHRSRNSRRKIGTDGEEEWHRQVLGCGIRQKGALHNNSVSYYTMKYLFPVFTVPTLFFFFFCLGEHWIWGTVNWDMDMIFCFFITYILTIYCCFLGCSQWRWLNSFNENFAGKSWRSFFTAKPYTVYPGGYKSKKRCSGWAWPPQRYKLMKIFALIMEEN